jgi:hypothetical protein
MARYVWTNNCREAIVKNVIPMPDLRDWLANAEVRYRRIFRSLQPAPIGALMPVALQVFAYHETHDATRTPVICVGSNYSQGEGQVGEGCGANLSQWVKFQQRYQTRHGHFAYPL